MGSAHSTRNVSRGTPQGGVLSPLLWVYAKSWASATALRFREAAAWTTGSTGHSNILSKHTSLPRSTDYVPPKVNFERRYKIFIPTRTDWDNLPHQFENAVNIYTDSFKLNSQTGGEVFSPELDLKFSFRLPDHWSVFKRKSWLFRKP